MDESTKEMVTAVSEALKPFANLAERLFGTTFDELGGLVAAELNTRRRMRQLKLLKQINKAIEEAGFDARTIPDAVWVPAVQQALLEDDETLQAKWAYLLANASDPRLQDFSPAFGVILREMAGNDVKFLDAIVNEVLSGQSHTNAAERFTFHELYQIYQRANGLIGMDRGDLNMSMDLLARNRLLTSETAPVPIDLKDLIQRLPAGNIPRQVPVKLSQYFRITDLGMRFVAVCRAPASRKPADLREQRTK